MLFEQLFSNPMDFLRSLLVTLPGILLALSGHEAAHAYVANKCGDPTARLMGRITLNPLKHIDPLGFVCMMLLGFGWAKPVPVNPYNLRKGRRDDFFVSIAGITANIIMALTGFILMTALFMFAMSRLPVIDIEPMFKSPEHELSMLIKNGEHSLIYSYGMHYSEFSMTEVFQTLSGFLRWVVRDVGATFDVYSILTPTLGKAGVIAYDMLRGFVTINIALAVFNLIPVPPLDGYHVLNDLVLKRPLFAAQKAARIGTGVLFALIMVGNINPKLDVISLAINFVLGNSMEGLSRAAQAVCGLFGLI